MSKKIFVCICALVMIAALAGCTSGRASVAGNMPPPTVPSEFDAGEQTTAPLATEPVFGTWAWQDDARYHLVLNEDGSGSRGIAPATQQFEWTSPEPGRLLIRVHTAWEYWDYTSVNGVLTITSLQLDNMTYSYSRA